MRRCVPFLLFFLAGILFSNPVQAQLPQRAENLPVQAGAGQNKTVQSGSFIIGPSPSLPAILFAHDGGTITTTPGGLTLAVGQPTTGLAATRAGEITADAITLTGVNQNEMPGFPGVLGNPATGASADNGGTISISNSTINATLVGLSAGTEGHISTNKVDIVLGGPHPTGPQIGAQILNANSTLTLTGGSIRDISVGGGGD